MELSEETQECPYCGLCYTDFEFHIRIHDDCKMLEEQRKALGRKREDMLGLEDALKLVDSHLQTSVDEEEDGGGDGQQEELGNFEAGSDSGFIVPKIELGIRKTELLEECGVFLAKFEDESEAVDLPDPLAIESEAENLSRSEAGGFPIKMWNNFQSIKTELKDTTSEKQEDEELESGNLEVKQEEQTPESEPNKVTLIVKTSSEPGPGSPTAKSRTFKMVMKPGCSVAKVKESMSKTLNVPVQRIVLKKNRTKGNIDDSCLVQEFHDSVIFACLL